MVVVERVVVLVVRRTQAPSNVEHWTAAAAVAASAAFTAAAAAATTITTTAATLLSKPCLHLAPIALSIDPRVRIRPSGLRVVVHRVHAFTMYQLGIADRIGEPRPRS